MGKGKCEEFGKMDGCDLEQKWVVQIVLFVGVNKNGEDIRKMKLAET